MPYVRTSRTWLWMLVVIVVAASLFGSRPRPLAAQAPALVAPTITYRANVAGLGFLSPVSNGATAGTTGQGRAAHGFDFQLSNNSANAGLRCEAHVSNIGWLPEVGEGPVCGQLGSPNFRVEAIKLRLVNAPGLTIQYRCHLAFIGWTGFVSDGAMCGTTGQGRQMEALEVRVSVRPVNQNPSTGTPLLFRLASDQAGTRDQFNVFFDAPLVPAQSGWSAGVFGISLPQAAPAVSRPSAVWADPQFRGACLTVAAGERLRLPFLPRSVQVGRTCPTAADFDSQQRSEVLFYSGPDRQGARTSVFTDQNGVNPPVQDAKSYSVPKGKRIALYAGAGFTGPCETLVGIDPVLSGNLSDLTAFRNARPVSLAFDLDCGDPVDGSQAVLWSLPGFKGSRLRVTRDIANLSERSFAKLAASLELKGVQAVALYSEPDFGGTCSTAVFHNHADLSGLTIGAGTVQSIKVRATCSGPAVLTPMILDIDAVTGAATRCPRNTEKVLPNLNEGAGGTPVFLCVEYGTPRTPDTRVLTDFSFVVNPRFSSRCQDRILGESAGGVNFGVNFNEGVQPTPNPNANPLTSAFLDTIMPIIACYSMTAANAAGARPVHDIAFVVNPGVNLATETNTRDANGLRRLEMTACPPGLPGYTPVRYEDQAIGGGPSANALDLNAQKQNSPQIFACNRLSGNAASAPIGTPAIITDAGTPAAGEETTVSLTWTVPEPRVWRDLAQVFVRIGSEDETVLVARFDTESGMTELYNPATSEFSGFDAATGGLLETDSVRVRLPAEAVSGSGPEGRVVTVSLSLAFTPAAAGRTFRIDVLAVDRQGEEQAELGVGAIAVAPLPAE